MIYQQIHIHQYRTHIVGYDGQTRSYVANRHAGLYGIGQCPPNAIQGPF